MNQIKKLSNCFVSTRGIVYNSDGEPISYENQPVNTRFLVGQQKHPITDAQKRAVAEEEIILKETKKSIFNLKYERIKQPYIHMFSNRNSYPFGHLFDQLQNLRHFINSGLEKVPLATSRHVGTKNMDKHLKYLWPTAPFQEFKFTQGPREWPTSTLNKGKYPKVFKFDTLFIFPKFEEHQIIKKGTEQAGETPVFITRKFCPVGSYVSPQNRDFILKQYSPLFKNLPPQRLYIHRPSQTETRNIKNEKKTLDFFKNRGFKIICCATVPLEDIIPMWQNAEVIVGPHGAAFNHNIFCQKNPLIIEFGSPALVRNTTWTGNSKRFGLDHHHYITVSGDPNLHYNDARNKIEIDLNKVDKLMIEYFCNK